MRGKFSGPAAETFHTRWETHVVALAEGLRTDSWKPGSHMVM